MPEAVPSPLAPTQFAPKTHPSACTSSGELAGNINYAFTNVCFSTAFLSISIATATDGFNTATILLDIVVLECILMLSRDQLQLHANADRASHKH
jgi:hypothetical protein